MAFKFERIENEPVGHGYSLNQGNEQIKKIFFKELIDYYPEIFNERGYMEIYQNIADRIKTINDELGLVSTKKDSMSHNHFATNQTELVLFSNAEKLIRHNYLD